MLTLLGGIRWAAIAGAVLLAVACGGDVGGGHR
jgi:hypothetical protein